MPAPFLSWRVKFEDHTTTLDNPRVLEVIALAEAMAGGRRFAYGSRGKSEAERPIKDYRAHLADHGGHVSLWTNRRKTWKLQDQGIFLSMKNVGGTYLSIYLFGSPPLPPLSAWRALMLGIARLFPYSLGHGEVVFTHERERDHSEWPFRGASAFFFRPRRDMPKVNTHLAESRGGPGPAMPERPWWLNYWGPRSCELAHFPPPESGRDAYVFAAPVEGGGWLWQMTDDPLDLRRADHRRAYRRVYDVFLELGNRDPRSPWPRTSRLARPIIGQELEFHLICPTLGPGDRRPLALIEALEAFYEEVAPGEEIEIPLHHLVYTDERNWMNWGEPRVADRETFVLTWPEGDIPRMYNGLAFGRILLAGHRYDRPAPGYLFVRVLTPIWVPRRPTVSERRADVLLERLAEAGRAYWGRALVNHDYFVTEAQIDAGDPRDEHPDYLPLLDPEKDMPDVYTPYALGWVNYWSPETCARMGFPRSAEEADEPLRSRMRPARSGGPCGQGQGGWIWQTTPWGIGPSNDPARTHPHARTYAWAYARFPQVGRRKAWAQPDEPR